MASNINIGRQGWTGIALEATPGVGVSPTDYVQFLTNTLFGDVKNENISNATQNRHKVFNSVPTQKYGKGDLEIYADPKIMGYFLVAAMGKVSVANPSAGVYDHTITVQNANSNPQTLTLINDRQGSTDQEAYYNAVVDQFHLTIADNIGTAKSTIMSNFPQTTTSGTATTASGTVYAFPSAKFSFGSSVAVADGNANLKVHEFQLNIKNNAKPVFRHGNILPDTFNFGDFEAEATFKLYFENATDRNSYYNSSKQSAVLSFAGNPLGGGLSEWTKFRWYQTRIDTFVYETGLSNFYIEDVKLMPEQDNVSGTMMDVLIRNSKSLYI